MARLAVGMARACAAPRGVGLEAVSRWKASHARAVQRLDLARPAAIWGLLSMGRRGAYKLDGEGGKAATGEGGSAADGGKT